MRMAGYYIIIRAIGDMQLIVNHLILLHKSALIYTNQSETICVDLWIHQPIPGYISIGSPLILLIDSWGGPTTLDILAKKRKGVNVEVVTSPRGNKLAQSDIEKFNDQYGGLSVKTSAAFHDRFLIIDDKELYLIGASLKDLGRKCFGFSSLAKSNITDILTRLGVRD